MPKVELLEADIRDELGKLAKLEREFLNNAEEKLLQTADSVDFYDRAAIGYILQSFYNGCENIFRTIASFFENELEPSGWHSSLPKRIKLEIEGYRPAVIDEELYLLLEGFRGFRYAFRHSYVFELDWDRERLVAAKFPRALELLREQVLSFLRRLGELSAE